MKKLVITLLFVFIAILFSACAQFTVNNVSEIRLISRDEGVKAVLYSQDEDFQTLINTCKGSSYKEFSGCPFGISEIQFVTDNETISIYPAGDHYSKFAFGELSSDEELSLVDLPEDKMDIIYDILEKYGVQTEGA